MARGGIGRARVDGGEPVERETKRKRVAATKNNVSSTFESNIQAGGRQTSLFPLRYDAYLSPVPLSLHLRSGTAR